MREARKRPPRPLLNTRQWVILELLFLANGLVVAVFGILAFSGSFAGARSMQFAAPTRIIMPAANTTVGPFPTPLPIATGTPALLPSQAAGLISPGSLVPSSTPTSVIPGLSATPAGRDVQQNTRPDVQPNVPAAASSAEVLLDLAGHAQSLPLSCESRSAADWAAFFGVGVDELEFFSRLPLSDNPDVGFAGDVNGGWGQVPPNPYGVHAAPVAALLRDYGVSAEARREMTWEELRSEIDGGRPVIAWVVGHVWPKGKAVEYTAADGAVVTVAPYEHTVIVVGYGDGAVVVRDGARLARHSLDNFLGSWAVLGNMAITSGP